MTHWSREGGGRRQPFGVELRFDVGAVEAVVLGLVEDGIVVGHTLASELQLLVLVAELGEERQAGCGHIDRGKRGHQLAHVGEAGSDRGNPLGGAAARVVGVASAAEADGEVLRSVYD